MRRTALLLSLLIPLCLDAQSSALAVLEGDVVDAATNAPLAYARVRLQRLEPIYTKVDPQGHFVFAGLTPGRYQLTIESPGFMQSSNVQVDLTGPSARDSVIKSVGRGSLGTVKFSKQIADDGVIHGAVTVQLAGQAVITGKVTDPYGLPVIGSTVEILMKPTSGPGVAAAANAAQPAIRASVRADDLGQYRVSGLQPGTYWVVANTGNSGSGIALTSESSQRTTYYPAGTRLDAAKPIALSAGQTKQADIQIVRVAGVRVSGKIIRPPSVSDSMVDVPGVGPHSTLFTQVMLVPRDGPSMSYDGKSAAGKDDYDMKDVLPGKYTLMAAMIKNPQDVMGPDRKAVAGLVREVEIGPQDMAGLDLALEPARDLPGEVTFGEGCEPGPLSIRTAGFSPFAPGQAKAISGPDGKFVLTGLTAGHFNIMASWVDRPGPQLMLSSVRLGDRDVLANGFDAPYSGSEPLRITLNCPSAGRRR